MNYVCGDNRFEIIERYKNELISATNIESSPEEMAVLDNILFRFWQMGCLKEQAIGQYKREQEKAKELKEGWADLCPICEYQLEHCQCRFGGSAHPDRSDRARVVFDHLYLLTPGQLNHVMQVQSFWQTSYGDEKLNKILLDLIHKANKNRKVGDVGMKEYYDWDDGCYEKVTRSNELAQEKNRYSEEIKDELVGLMIKYLENHEIFRLLELVVSAVATKEQKGSVKW